MAGQRPCLWTVLHCREQDFQRFLGVDGEQAAARRTAPVSAPIVEELPSLSLPKPIVSTRHGTPCYTVGQMMDHTRDAVAPYAERIRQLERELAAREVYEVPIPGDGVFGGLKVKIDPTLPVNTIELQGANRVRVNLETGAMTEVRELAERTTASIGDDGEFQDLAGDIYRAGSYNESIEKPLNALIAYIDGRTAGTALDPRVDDLAALIRQLVHSLKKSRPDSDLLARAMDYLQRKGLAGSPLRAAAPTPMNSGMEEGND